MNQQAKALGVSLSNTQFLAIHTSPLKRAFMTAQAIQDAQPDPKSPLISSPLLREQHFGQGEGKLYRGSRNPGISLEDRFAMGRYPALHSRTENFPGGESLEDLAHRAEQAIKDIILPYVLQEGTQGDHAHVAIVSHGLCISEMVAMLVRKGGQLAEAREYRGLINTGWAAITVKTKVR